MPFSLNEATRSLYSRVRQGVGGVRPSREIREEKSPVPPTASSWFDRPIDVTVYPRVRRGK